MESPAKVLIIGDERRITENLKPMLERSGYIVGNGEDSEGALHRVETFVAGLIVLDVLMARVSGREVLRQLRKAGNWVPIILLTQVGGAGERAMALEEGADDYLNKPFDPHELVARIRAVLRRARAGRAPLSAAHRLNCGSLVLDRVGHRAWLNSQEIQLTPKAVALLEYLMTHPDEVITRERLLDVVWGWDFPAGTRAVDTRIAELRRGLGDEPAQPRYIVNVSGHGYRFIGAVEAAA